MSESVKDQICLGEFDFVLGVALNITIHPIKFIGDEDREVLLVACLSTQNKLLSCHIATLDMNLVSPREVFKTAIMQNAAPIIVAYNHVSSNVIPSPEDVDITKRLKQVDEIVGVELLDHLIVTNNQCLRKKDMYNINR